MQKLKEDMEIIVTIQIDYESYLDIGDITESYWVCGSYETYKDTDPAFELEAVVNRN